MTTHLKLPLSFTFTTSAGRGGNDGSTKRRALSVAAELLESS